MSAVRNELREILHDASSPLLPFINVAELKKMTEPDSPSSDFPWFGQLMTGPQLFAFLIQTDYWLRTYKVSVK
ncbi:Asparagine synthetase [glutamine-hydrolyzing] 3 [compost metagenome]